jgi:hypothetical protein
MLGLIKTLPIIILLAGSGYAAHKFIVNQYEGRVVQLQMNLDQMTQQNVALQTAAQQNEATIRSMEQRAKEQTAQISTLATQSSQWEQQAKDAMQIFADHNFTKLARLRPDTIERQANDATKRVFDGVEEDSRETAGLNDENN